MNKWILGLDGGGTKTVCVAIDEQANVRAESRTDSTNRNSVGDDAARANMEKAISDALAQVNAGPDDVAAICLGMAGVGRPADRERVARWVRDILPGAPAAIHNDSVIALASGTRGQLYGVVVISGTGMISYGFDRQGNEARAGGWGALLGDEGGGYEIGSAVLHAVTAAVDDRGPQTALCDAVLSHLGLSDAQELIDWAYADTSWQRFAALAPLAMTWAERGDGVAQQIVQQAARDLAMAAGAVVRKLALDQEPFPLVLAGGNLHSGPLLDALRERLQTKFPQATIQQPQVDPAIGAALLALNNLHARESES